MRYLLFVSLLRPAWSRIKKGECFFCGNCWLGRFYNSWSFLFWNQLMFLAFSTSSKSFSLGVPHSAQNLLLFPACALYNKNMPQEAMKIPCINIKTYELQISSFFQASQMNQFQTFVPKINNAFTLQKKLQILIFFSMHQASFHVYGFVISTSFY